MTSHANPGQLPALGAEALEQFQRLQDEAT